MKHFLFVKYFKESLVASDLIPKLQSFALVLFVVFFLSMLLWVITKPKDFYKEASENPLNDDTTF